MKITTPGSILIKSMLPTEEAKKNYDIYKPLDKSGMGKLVNNLIQHGGSNAHNTMNDLGKMFFNKATSEGYTTPLDDYDNDSVERQTIMSEFEHKVQKVLEKNLSKMDQARELDALSREYNPRMSRSNLIYMLQRGSTAAKMAQTGARGKPEQLMQGTATPMMAADVKGIPIPVPIKHSFAEGLSSAEHLAMSYGGRASTVLSQLSTEKPGSLFKKITPSVFHEVITEVDCGTKNGIPIQVSDIAALLGKVEAGTNKLITEEYYKELQHKNKPVIARSPMTCQTKEGLCQKCYGLAANSQFPAIGTNVGVIASQSVSEVLTQAMLSTKHQGGVAGRTRNPYDEAANLLNNPENFQDEATIAEANGKVDSMEQTSLKDWNVSINGKVHFIPNQQNPIIKLGDKVRIGDPLSTGTLNPEKLVELKGAGAGRIYLAKKMRDIYSRSAQLDPRHFDIIARNMIKYHTVIDPGESGFAPGDKIDVNQLEEYLDNNSKVINIDHSIGKVLAKRVLDLTPGTEMTQNHIDDLKEKGIQEVPISTSGITVKPLVPGLQSLKLLDKNWISKLSFNQLHRVIQEAAAMSQKSPIHSTEPVTSYMIGNEFGEGNNGKY